MSYPNGVATSYTYDTLSRLTRLKADKGATPITDFQYLYDAAGNRTRKQQLDFTEDYAYDKLYRLTGVERTGVSTGRWQYSYDAVGNRLSEQVNDTVSSSTYNSKNQLLSTTGGGPLRWRGTLNEQGNVTFTTVTVNGQPARMLPGNVFEAMLPMAAGDNTVTVQATDTSGNVTTKNYRVNVTGSGASYTHDLNGNLIQKVEGGDTWGYEWNAENQLTRVTKNAVEQARFKYDPLGRRVEKVAGGVTTTWTYDDEDILRQVAGAATLKYVHGLGIDEPLATDDGSTLAYLQADGLGSVVKTTNSTGSVTLTRQYDAWGNLQAGAVNGYAFTGREWDPETGLYYYRARYYDPRSGRFIVEDPLGSKSAPNLYMYVENAPVLWTDPSGLLTYQKGIKPATGPLRINLECLEDCLGYRLHVTGTRRGPTPRDPFDARPHYTGLAADVILPMWPSKKDIKDFICCARARSFGKVLDEYTNPTAEASGLHMHVQVPRGPKGSTRLHTGDNPQLTDCMCSAS